MPVCEACKAGLRMVRGRGGSILCVSERADSTSQLSASRREPNAGH